MRQFRGKVVEKRVSAGSKSERTAVVLQTTDGEELVIRRVGGHPFRDPQVAALVGQTIEARGRRSGSTVFVDQWAVEDGSVDTPRRPSRAV